MASCSRGWGERCSRATSSTCTCQCGGVNHGKAHLTPEQQEYASRLQEDAALPICIVCGEPIPTGTIRFSHATVLDATGPAHLDCYDWRARQPAEQRP